MKIRISSMKLLCKRPEKNQPYSPQPILLLANVEGLSVQDIWFRSVITLNSLDYRYPMHRV